jgi:hypothetical protein
MQDFFKIIIVVKLQIKIILFKLILIIQKMFNIQ